MNHGDATSLEGATNGSYATLVASLSQFDGTPVQFLGALLEAQCELTDAKGAAILALPAEARHTNRFGILTIHPPPSNGGPAPAWLTRASETAPRVLSGGETTIVPLSQSADGTPVEHLVLLPLQGAAGWFIDRRNNRLGNCYRVSGTDWKVRNIRCVWKPLP